LVGKALKEFNGCERRLASAKSPGLQFRLHSLANSAEPEFGDLPGLKLLILSTTERLCCTTSPSFFLFLLADVCFGCRSQNGSASDHDGPTKRHRGAGKVRLKQSNQEFL
jgi:hypothetical protein